MFYFSLDIMMRVIIFFTVVGSVYIYCCRFCVYRLQMVAGVCCWSGVETSVVLKGTGVVTEQMHLVHSNKFRVLLSDLIVEYMYVCNCEVYL